MALILLASLLGLSGHGPLSSTILDDPASGLLIRYERFERVNAQTLFRIQLNSQAPRNSSGQVISGTRIS